MSVFLSKNILLRVFYFNHSCAKKYTVLLYRPIVFLCYDESTFFMLFITIILRTDMPISEQTVRI